MQKISEGKADFSDTAVLSSRCAELLGEVLGDAIIDLPPEARESICTALLQDQYTETYRIVKAVQEELDSTQGLHLQTARVPFPEERVQQLAHSLCDPTVSEETIRRRAEKPTATVCKSFHDDAMRANAKLRHDMGLRAKIVREGTGCCKWCAEVSGSYIFGDQPQDIFRRHDNCTCIIYYDGTKLRGKLDESGRRTKTWEEVPDVPETKPTVLTPEQAQAFEQSQLSAIAGLTNGGESDRIEIVNRNVRMWYHDHIHNIPNEIPDGLSDEDKARAAFELRNQYRTQARILMIDPKQREELDRDHPNPTFEQLLESKMRRKSMTREQAIRDIYDTAVKSNAAYDKLVGL